MDKKQAIKAIKDLRAQAKKRNFVQSVEILVTLVNLDLKKQDHKVETYVSLPHKRGKQVKVCALVGGALHASAKEHADLAIIQEDFKALTKSKKEIKKLVRDYDMFIAQADIMPAIATSFGRFLGPKGKMPSPKAGGILSPKGNVKDVVARMQKIVKISAKTEMAAKCSLAQESMTDEEIAENIVAVHQALVNALPQHEQNVKNTYIKFSMSKTVQVGGKNEQA